MKTKLWMLGAAVAALTSCTQSEVVEMPESRVIKFESHVDKSARAVTDLKISTLTNYWVFGYHTNYTTDANTNGYSFTFNDNKLNEVFKNNEIKLSGDSWTYEKDGYWSKGEMYRFAAYSNGNNKLDNVDYKPGADQLTFESYTVTDASVDGNKFDLIAAISGDRTGESGTTDVQLVFRHMLSKVTLTLINASANETLEFSAFKIADISKQGTCTYNYTNHGISWSNLSDAEDFSYGAAIVPPAANSVTSHPLEFYMIPQSNNGKKLTFTLVEKVGTQEIIKKQYEADLTALTKIGDTSKAEWLPGYHYNYLITLGTTLDKITFNVNKVNDWNGDVNGDGYSETNDYIQLTLEDITNK